MDKNYSLPLVSLNFFLKNRKNLKKVVLTGGTFNIVHVGHINHLKRAKTMGDTLVVQIISDKKARELKKEEEIFSDRKRAIVVSAIRFVDYVFIYNGLHYEQNIIDKVKPDILFFNKENYTDEVKKEVKKLKGFQGRAVAAKERSF